MMKSGLDAMPLFLLDDLLNVQVHLNGNGCIIIISNLLILVLIMSDTASYIFRSNYRHNLNCQDTI